jgi:hypothetical protein
LLTFQAATLIVADSATALADIGTSGAAAMYAVVRILP